MSFFSNPTKKLTAKAGAALANTDTAVKSTYLPALPDRKESQSGEYLPESWTFEEWVWYSNEEEAIKARQDYQDLAWIQSGYAGDWDDRQEKIDYYNKRIATRRKRFEKTNHERQNEQLKDSIPNVVDEATINPEDLQYLEVGAPLDYSDAINALYDPSADYTNALNGLFDPSTLRRDTAGRDAQLGAIDYYKKLIASGGQDAVSEANYRKMRADAEQAARAQRQAAMQNLAEQGRDTGGAGVLAEMMAARDVGRNANAGALASKAMEQQRRDNAATSMGTFGGQVQTGDDAWTQWFGEAKAGYGRDRAEVIGKGSAAMTAYGADKAGIEQAESLNNFTRTNAVGDANVGLYNQSVYHNAELPIWGFEQIRGITGEEIGQGLSQQQIDEMIRKNKADEEFDPWKFLAEATKTGAQIYQAGKGGPEPPHFNTQTGEAYYDPQTGQRYTP